MSTDIKTADLLSFDDVCADLNTLTETWRGLGWHTAEGDAFYKRFKPTQDVLSALRCWGNNTGADAKAELRAAMGRAIRSGRLVRGTPPSKTEAERVCLEYQGEIACGVWVYLSPLGEIVGAEVVDFPSHDGAGWRGWKLAA
jgi:hypothetical protein